MRLITPSQWLADLVGESFLKDYPVEVRHNTIDVSVFKPTASDFRVRYGIDDRFMVLGVASPWTERKGLSDFVRLAGELDSDKFAIVLIGLSDKQKKQMPAGVVGLGRTDSPKELAMKPTRRRTYSLIRLERTIIPTTLLEAQACGTDAITYAVGGSGEAILREGSCSTTSYEDALASIKRMCAKGSR